MKRGFFPWIRKKWSIVSIWLFSVWFHNFCSYISKSHTQSVEITYAISLSGTVQETIVTARNMSEEKSTTRQGLICAEILPLHVFLLFPQGNNQAWAHDPIEKPSIWSAGNLKNTRPRWILQMSLRCDDKYWSADTLSWQLSINVDMDFQC